MMLQVAEIARRQATLWTDRIHTLPIVVLTPHSGCNCRCVMCDIWMANDRREELSRDDLERHARDFQALGVRRVVLTGGEPLMHANLWGLCEVLRAIGIRLTLLSTGLLLRSHAVAVVRWCDEVIVSLDGGPALHDRIRRCRDAFAQLVDGVAALREVEPRFRVTGRCVVQRANFDALSDIVDAARSVALDQISFLAVDVTSEAFNRPAGWSDARADDVALGPTEARALVDEVERLIARQNTGLPPRFVAESPDRLRALAGHFLAMNGLGEQPLRSCNAPWVSTVIEADGTVRPCFFHPPLGNLRDGSLSDILNAERAVRFRKELDVARDEVCHTCVCTLHRSAWAEV